MWNTINYNLAVHVPLTAIPNRESRGCLPQWGRWREAPEGLTDRTRPPCESRAAPSSPSGETSARSADNSVRSTATLRAGAQSKRPKSAKGVWVGRQTELSENVRVSPTSNTLSLLSLSSETVRWTVSKEHYTSKLPLFCGTYFPDGENQHYREPDYHALAHKPVCEAYPERGIRQEALHEV